MLNEIISVFSPASTTKFLFHNLSQSESANDVSTTLYLSLTEYLRMIAQNLIKIWDKFRFFHTYYLLIQETYVEPQQNISIPSGLFDNASCRRRISNK